MTTRRGESFAALDREASSLGERGAVGAPILPCQGHWLTIELYDDDGKPMANQAYVVRRASGGPVQPGAPRLTGVLDRYGCARILMIDGADDCIVEFPGLAEADVSFMDDDFWQNVPVDG